MSFLDASKATPSTLSTGSMAFVGGNAGKSPITMLQSSSKVDGTNKRVVFIRHGCTHMNEYLSTCPWGSPGFTDIFPQHRIHLYRDSPLSPRGVRQAQALAKSLGELGMGHEINELDLIIVSPLTRALQTLEIGLLPHIFSGNYETDQRPKVPIVALPHAAERLYLISDVGKPRQELHEQYGHFVDFSFEEEEWWFMHDKTVESYVEWRPNGRYACRGEPDRMFDSRMTRLYKWIEDRPESTIAVICHWGVIEWMLDEDFHNCEMRVVPFDEIKPKSMTVSTTRGL